MFSRRRQTAAHYHKATTYHFDDLPSTVALVGGAWRVRQSRRESTDATDQPRSASLQFPLHVRFSERSKLLTHVVFSFPHVPEECPPLYPIFLPTGKPQYQQQESERFDNVAGGCDSHPSVKRPVLLSLLRFRCAFGVAEGSVFFRHWLESGVELHEGIVNSAVRVVALEAVSGRVGARLLRSPVE